MKQRWSNKAKLIRNMLVSAKLRGDTERIKELEQKLNHELTLSNNSTLSA